LYLIREKNLFVTGTITVVAQLLFLLVVHVLLGVDLRLFLCSGLGHVKINFTSMLWSRTCGDWLKLLDRKQIYLLQCLQFIYYFVCDLRLSVMNVHY
jgi:hypothetical protein